MAQTYNPAARRIRRADPLAGLRVAITGGTSGLGLALVREFGARGARVAFVARDRVRVERIAAATGAHGIVGDVARKEDIHPIAMQVVGLLGGLDILINNASSLGPVPLRPLGDTDCEDLELALATNLVGPFRLTKALLGALAASAREARGAVVLNVSSDAAINAYPGWGAYGASKAALHHLSRIWQEEFAIQGVRFLSLDPGDMDTPLHALAVPDADRATLKRPETAARELIHAVTVALAGRSGRQRSHVGADASVETAAASG
jgi:NAD(P)-dependent dehydrogenase (short-subunit alcohol dehydrogenase family)